MFTLKVTQDEAIWLADSLMEAKRARDPIIVEEYEWLVIQPRLVLAMKGARKCETVEELDVIISECKSIIGERNDREIIDMI